MKKRSFARKVSTAVLSAVVAMSLFAVPALAAGPWDSYTPSNDDTRENSPSEVPVLVEGYVGEDATAPDFTPYEINVSVPTKVLWAAFESDRGTVTAPNYYIKNNSRTNDLKVTLLSFTAKSTDDNTAIDKDLVLSLQGKQGGFGTNAIKLFDKNSGVTLPSAAFPGFDAQAQWDFTFDGSWDGDFDDTTTPYRPTYDLVFKFESAA